MGNTAEVSFEFKDPDFEGLKKFLVETCSFNTDRVDRYVERLKAAKNRTKQRPLDSFFGKPKVTITDADKFDALKKKGGAKSGAKAAAKAGSAGAKRPSTGQPNAGAKRARI